jgi:universal stress protein A
MNNYRHVVCATDFSAGSEQACLRAAALSGCFGARLTLLHVVEHFPQDRSNEVVAPEDTDPRAYREAHARAQLDTLARAAGCGDAERKVRFSTESAWHEIGRFVQEAAVDLIVLSGHPHSGPGTLVPSTSGHLSVQHPCDILTVQGEAPKSSS